jgi:alpha-ketoglutarate-dependent taurine dioxygenase
MSATTEPAFPLIVECAGADDVTDWIQEHPDYEDQLLHQGAVLFRGYGVTSAESFRDVAEAFAPDLLDYVYRSTPRTALGGGIYTASEYPSTADIPQHNENSYQREWPLLLVFGCLRAAARGGETPLARTRRVTARIDAAVLDEFATRGIMYIRNYGSVLDLPWQTAFQTDDRRAVEDYCAREGIDVEWTWPDSLRTRQVCHAIAVHPRTGERLWFNQARLFHVSSLDTRTRDSMLSVLRHEDLPRHACYGDGAPIAETVLDHLRDAYAAETTAFGWKTGDVLLVDNMLVSHGRTSFTGPRNVAVAMARPCRTGVPPAIGVNAAPV